MLQINDRVMVAHVIISPLASLSNIHITEKTVYFKPQRLSCSIENDCVISRQTVENNIIRNSTNVRTLSSELFSRCQLGT